MTKNYVTDAINLKSYNLNDADKIIVMYSKDNGLIKGVAKGIKKNRWGDSVLEEAQTRNRNGDSVPDKAV